MMRKLSLIVLLVLVMGSPYSQEIDNSDPEIRQGVIDTGWRFYLQGKNREAFLQFYYGISNWNEPEQRDHKINACQSLFTLVFVTDTISNFEEQVRECPAELTNVWFEKENRDHEPLLKTAP